MGGKEKSFTRKNMVIVALLVVVWGTIFYKIFFGNKATDFIVNTAQSVPKQDVVALENKTYQLKNNYKDPFLGNYKRKIVTGTSKKEKKKKPKPKLQPKNNIEYKGIVNDNNTATAYIIYNGKSFLMHRGDSIGNYILQGIYQDSIFVQAKKEFVWIRAKCKNTYQLNVSI